MTQIMNRLNFNQSIGFPLETNILDEMQTSWSVFNALGAIVGNFTIIMGCDTVGTTISNGVVYINGEVLEFRGGVVQNNVIIVEEPQALEFEDASTHDVIFTRYATFGSATTQYPWNTFKRGFETKEIPTELNKKEDKTTVTALDARIAALENKPATGVPTGLIALWERPADQIPAGWREWTEMAGRSPVGFDMNDSDFNVVGKEIGSKTASLKKENNGPHTHKTTVNQPYVYSSDGGFDGGGQFLGNKEIESTSSGTGTPFSILNPKRVVRFIIKL